MQISHDHAKLLLKGNHMFSMWSLSILVTRLKQLYSSDPSDDVLDNCTSELNAFVRKFQKVMGRDYALIESLVA